jgi:hypothetical protein
VVSSHGVLPQTVELVDGHWLAQPALALTPLPLYSFFLTHLLSFVRSFFLSSFLSFSLSFFVNFFLSSQSLYKSENSRILKSRTEFWHCHCHLGIPSIGVMAPHGLCPWRVTVATLTGMVTSLLWTW